MVGCRCIACRLQTSRPTAIVVGGVGEERIVTRRRVEKFGMVQIRLLDRPITAETFAFGIVVVIDTVSRPRLLAFDAEVVVGVASQSAVAAVGFEYALRHGDTCGNAVTLHVGDGYVLVACYVLFARLAGLCSDDADEQNGEKRRDYCLL